MAAEILPLGNPELGMTRFELMQLATAETTTIPHHKTAGRRKDPDRVESSYCR